MSPETFTPAFASSTPTQQTVDSRAAGYAAGYASGYAAGAREAAHAAELESERVRTELAAAEARRVADHQAALVTLAAAARAADERALPVLAESEQTLVGAALELAAAVLGRELSDAETSARAALGRVLAAMPGPGLHTVRLHPADLETLRRLDATGDPALTGVTLDADPTLSPGDAVGEFADGVLDARIGAALERARAELGVSAR
ncbi:FliH/SctL family protein [Cellulomonas sp. NPDC089187]|uniref:FliH/SctL family protein n=1 Tax=Cellulomonas sp. NPDC089187 TaxID=3154970 RepID=UPI0034183C3D